MAGGYTDVGESLRTVFEVAFYAACILLATGLIHIAFKTKYIRLPVRTLAVLAHWFLLGATIASLVMRF